MNICDQDLFLFRTIDDDFEVDSRLSLGAFDVSGGSVNNPYGKVSVQGLAKRLRECCRQSQVEVVSKSSNKIHQTWGLPFSPIQLRKMGAENRRN